jgi:L-lysine exporter family protein LysE/ArgO
MNGSALQGFAASLGLIVAIGAQNAFVLRQGLVRAHVGPVVAVCVVSEALLIGAGVAGLGTLIEGSALLLGIARWGGAAFLAVYALLALRRAWRPGSLAAAARAETSLGRALAAVLAFTWLNPHCWLDTVVLLGSLASQAADRAAFAGGALAASTLWFIGLGYGAQRLAPLFAKPAAWRVLDAAIAAVMATIAVGLIRSPT